MKVYIAGPLTSSGNLEKNIENATKAAAAVVKRGHFPFCPHLLGPVYNNISPQPEEFWHEFCLAFLNDCDALIRLPGLSLGSDIEEKRAKQLGLPVYYGVESFISWYYD